MGRKHDSLLKCLKTQVFLNGKQYAVFSYYMGGDEDSPTYALYSKRQLKGLKHKPKVDHVERTRDHSVGKVLYWTWKEYLHGWKRQFAKKVDCGCEVFRGKRYMYCSTDHLFEYLGLGGEG